MKDGVYIYNSVWWHSHGFMIDRFIEFINEVNLISDREKHNSPQENEEQLFIKALQIPSY